MTVCGVKMHHFMSSFSQKYLTGTNIKEIYNIEKFGYVEYDLPWERRNYLWSDLLHFCCRSMGIWSHMLWANPWLDNLLDLLQPLRNCRVSWWLQQPIQVPLNPEPQNSTIWTSRNLPIEKETQVSKVVLTCCWLSCFLYRNREIKKGWFTSLNLDCI